MGIKDIPEIASRIEIRKELNKLDKSSQKKEGALKEGGDSASAKDSIEMSDAVAAVEKENILASKATIENFENAKSVLENILDGIDEKNLLHIHGNADKIKTFLIM